VVIVGEAFTTLADGSSIPCVGLQEKVVGGDSGLSAITVKTTVSPTQIVASGGSVLIWAESVTTPNNSISPRKSNRRDTVIYLLFITRADINVIYDHKFDLKPSKSIDYFGFT
jgi:hypothetical protein